MIRLRPLSLRTRLTLWFSLVFAVALFGLGFACLWMVHHAIDSLETNELQQRVRSVRRYLEVRPKDEDLAHLQQSITEAYSVSHGNKWLQIVDERGNWIYRSPHVATAYPTLTPPAQAAPGGTYFTYIAEGIHVRALIEPIAVHGVRYTVQTGLTLNKTLAILSSFGLQLFLLTGLGLLLSALAGHFTSRKALTPIAALAAEAQRINDKNLDLRLPALATRDELAALSSTLNQMLDRIEAGYQSVRSFTANAAHELRTPVALLRAEAEVTLAFDRDAPYYRNTCENFLSGSLRIARLIDQLLALARADAGVEPLHFEPVNLPDLLEDTAADWTLRFAEADIRFNLQLHSTADSWVEADYDALKRLLHILLENAWRYTPAGRSVALALAPQGSACEISITDTGNGIAPQDHARIFERFFRSGHPVRGDFPGSGLGLVLGQWIAERHGTAIHLESSPGRGSRFCFQLRPTTLHHAATALDSTEGAAISQPTP